METDTAERNMILERISNLQESLASRPSESKYAKQPEAVKTKLMMHQLQALEWLRWRETQKPIGGIFGKNFFALKRSLSLVHNEKAAIFIRHYLYLKTFVIEWLVHQF